MLAPGFYTVKDGVIVGALLDYTPSQARELRLGHLLNARPRQRRSHLRAAELRLARALGHCIRQLTQSPPPATLTADAPSFEGGAPAAGSVDSSSGPAAISHPQGA